MQDIICLGNCVQGYHLHETQLTSLFINTLPQHQKCCHNIIFNVHGTSTETGLSISRHMFCCSSYIHLFGFERISVQ
jgi:hypothetical protein